MMVDDVNYKFSNLIKLEESGWKKNNNTIKKRPRERGGGGRTITGITNKAKQDDGGRTATRII